MTRHPVLMLTRNNVNLTRRAVESVLAQDIFISLLIIDNDSTDGTTDWLSELAEHEKRLEWVGFKPQIGVSAGWNWGLRQFFEFGQEKHVLVLNNDVVLPTWFYRTLLVHKVPFVTGVAVNSQDARTTPPDDAGAPLNPHPDFSAFLIHRRAWELLGAFNEEMKHYASDCDAHVRGYQMGLGMWKANVPYWHLGSGTLKNASEAERNTISAQADSDRAVFRRIWGCVPGEEAYSELFRRTE